MSRYARVHCPRCGRDVSKGMAGRHLAVCERMPLPDDLAREYRRSGHTIQELATKYGVSRQAIMNALAYAEKRPRAPRKRKKIAAPKTHHRCCLRCGIRLDIPLARPAYDGLCHECVGTGETPNTFWVMAVQP